MKRLATVSLFAFALLIAGLLPAASPEGNTDWQRVEEILGKRGQLLEGGVYKVTFPRTDLRVHVGNTELPPGMGLGSWAAFLRTGEGRAVVTGDTCMLGGEVSAVIDALRAGGIQVVALHNHMLGEQPQVMFLHYQGRGSPEALARTIRSALDRLGNSE